MKLARMCYLITVLDEPMLMPSATFKVSTWMSRVHLSFSPATFQPLPPRGPLFGNLTSLKTLDFLTATSIYPKSQSRAVSSVAFKRHYYAWRAGRRGKKGYRVEEGRKKDGEKGVKRGRSTKSACAVPGVSRWQQQQQQQQQQPQQQQQQHQQPGASDERPTAAAAAAAATAATGSASSN
ncbi:hypothetical protein HZH66_002186 [Vespula vulgaris]|uniref:Uncharacterized protein n=1 Tax=Vespula vulgaris TaxID=7454 RepID=A0A834KGQ0_VESVU|nr:hypothetical protein HZH66_002186 [Vespula vulgaris]